MDFDPRSEHVVSQPARRRLLRGLIAGSLVLAAAPAIAACGGAPASTKPTGGEAAAKTANKANKAGGATTTVDMNDQNKFVPDKITVKKGTTVTWKNTGTMAHNVVSDPNLAIDKAHAKVPAGAQTFTSPMLTGGGTWSHTFDVAGEYTYFCQPHEALGMVGTVTVTE